MWYHWWRWDKAPITQSTSLSTHPVSLKPPLDSLLDSTSSLPRTLACMCYRTYEMLDMHASYLLSLAWHCTKCLTMQDFDGAGDVWGNRLIRRGGHNRKLSLKACCHARKYPKFGNGQLVLRGLCTMSPYSQLWCDVVPGSCYSLGFTVLVDDYAGW